MAFFFVWGVAGADTAPSLIDRVGSMFDSIARGLRTVGERSEDLITPRLTAPGDISILGFSEGPVASREVEEAFALDAGAEVHVENEFGAVQITGWEGREVRLRAELLAGAEDLERATAIVRAINIETSLSGGNLSIRTQLPPSSDVDGQAAMEVNYQIFVPRDAAVVCQNTWGDTSVAHMRGPVTIDSRHGAVSLHGIGGPVRVEARGEFPVEASALEAGGVFELTRSEARFSNTDGPLRVSNSMGSVILQDLPPNANIDVTTESGPIYLYLNDSDEPDLTASVTFGEIKSDAPLERTVRSGHTIARNRANGASQHVHLSASFDVIHVYRGTDSGGPQAATASSPGTSVIRAFQERSHSAFTVDTIKIDAIAGDVTVEGADVSMIEVRATQVLHMQRQDQVLQAQEALQLLTEEESNELLIQTKALEDMASFGCERYRVNLEIRVPRSLPLVIFGENGETQVMDMDNTISIQQEIGSINVDRVHGELYVSTGRGDVTIRDSSGPLRVLANGGDVVTRQIPGPQHITAYNGDTIVDTPGDALTIRHEDGDVRIVSLGGIGGDFNIQVDRGSISMIRSDDADARFHITVENGSVESAVPISGTKDRDYSDFTGRLNSGQHAVALHAKHGDVMID